MIIEELDNYYWIYHKRKHVLFSIQIYIHWSIKGMGQVLKWVITLSQEGMGETPYQGGPWDTRWRLFWGLCCFSHFVLELDNWPAPTDLLPVRNLLPGLAFASSQAQRLFSYFNPGKTGANSACPLWGAGVLFHQLWQCRGIFVFPFVGDSLFYFTCDKTVTKFCLHFSGSVHSLGN